MKTKITGFFAAAVVAAMATAGGAKAEILAMMNYESKPPDTLKAMKLKGPATRKEGIAIVDVDPDSTAFGKVLMDIPLPDGLVSHHIFYDREMEKAYVTALGKSQLHVFNMRQFPYRLKRIDLPDCKLGEDAIFSDDNKTWYVTCMMSARVIVGDVATDKVTQVIDIPDSYPHGLAVPPGTDRILVTSTVSGDLKDIREDVYIVEASTGKVLGKKKMSNKASPSKVGPVELLNVPGTNPPVTYVTNLFGGTIWAMTWNPAEKDFDTAEIVDFNPMKIGVPLEMYFNKAVDRMWVSTANPGHLHVFDLSAGPLKPKLIKTLATAQGSHHIAITKDERWAFVQNSLLNLPGMSEGNVTVVDLKAQNVVKHMNTLRDRGLNANSIVLLPEWNSLAGH